MRTAYSDAATTGGSNYADTFQINNYNVTNLEEHHINTYLKSTDQINYQNAVLAGVLSKFQVMLGGDLSLKSGPDLAFLISKIDGYSDNAPYNTNPENNEIDKTDVAQMFNLRVDTTYSVDYSDSDIPSIDYTKISSTTTFDSTLSIYKDIDFSQGYKNDVSQVV
jgi:hypothetical protein